MPKQPKEIEEVIKDFTEDRHCKIKKCGRLMSYSVDTGVFFCSKNGHTILRVK